MPQDEAICSVLFSTVAIILIIHGDKALPLKLSLRGKIVQQKAA
jgi:hypothetical protein